MSYINPDAEDALEQETIKLFASLGWTTANCRSEIFAPNGGPPSPLGRETSTEGIPRPRLRAGISRLNPALSPLVLELLLHELSKALTTICPANANKLVY